MTPEPFAFRDGGRVMHFGDGVARRSRSLLVGEGFADGEWVLLTTERGRSQMPADLLDAAGAELHVAPGPVPDAAAALVDEVGGRDMVAFGGGRVVDAAKAVAAVGRGRVAAIPTTLAGSTFTQFHRMPAGHQGYGSTTPSVAICDPELMASAPPQTLTATSMNALAHGIEALYGPLANPITEGAALRGAPLIVRGLEAEPARGGDLALGALLSGYAVGVAAGLVIHHACCQTLVGVLRTPHAQTNAIMLPRSIAFMADRAPQPLGLLAGALGEPDVAAVAARVGRLAAGAGPTTLAEVGVTAGQLDQVLDAVMEHPGVANTPGGVERQDVHALLSSAEPG